jgi:hypothetical protein
MPEILKQTKAKRITIKPAYTDFDIFTRNDLDTMQKIGGDTLNNYVVNLSHVGYKRCFTRCSRIKCAYKPSAQRENCRRSNRSLCKKRCDLAKETFHKYIVNLVIELRIQIYITCMENVLLIKTVKIVVC